MFVFLYGGGRVRDVLSYVALLLGFLDPVALGKHQIHGGTDEKHIQRRIKCIDK